MNTIKHTNGMPIYARLKKETQAKIEQKWVIPTDEDYLYIDKFERPFVQKPGQPMLYCQIRKSVLIDGGFHNHYIQK